MQKFSIKIGGANFRKSFPAHVKYLYPSFKTSVNFLVEINALVVSSDDVFSSNQLRGLRYMIYEALVTCLCMYVWLYVYVLMCVYG